MSTAAYNTTAMLASGNCTMCDIFSIQNDLTDCACHFDHVPCYEVDGVISCGCVDYDTFSEARSYMALFLIGILVYYWDKRVQKKKKYKERQQLIRESQEEKKSN